MLRLFIREARPLYLLGGLMLYALGVGIARYLGTTINWAIAFLGFTWVFLLQLGAAYLYTYYAPHRPGALQPALTETKSGVAPLRALLLVSGGCGAGLASLTVLMISQQVLNPAASIIMALAFLCAFFYATPGLRLENSGYGELLVSVVLVLLTPMLSFLLQTRETHRLVTMSASPLVFLHLAMMIAIGVSNYSQDIRYERKTLVVRMGWQNAMLAHNLLVFCAYLLLILARSLGYPWFATLAGLLSLPLGLYQIWQMRMISKGARPNWKLLVTSAAATFGAMIYLITYAFWTN